MVEIPDQSAIFTTSSRGTPFDLALVAEADRAECALNKPVSMPALARTDLIYLEIEHDFTDWCGLW